MSSHHFPICESTGRGKMSPQDALGPHAWPDEESRQSKWFKTRRHGTRKDKTLRTHRDGRSHA